MTKGGKFIFGKSLLREDGSLRLPPHAVEEYEIATEGRIYLFTGSRSTGGFCVTRKRLLLSSKLGHILTELPALMDYTAEEGAFLPYKGRWYGWMAISPDGMLTLSEPAMQFLKLAPGMELLSIRSSDIAFTLGAKGPLLEKAENYPGEIPAF